MGNPTDADVARFLADSAEALRACVTAQKRPAAACCDLRVATPLRPEVAERLAGLMKRDNPSVERSAILITKSATFALQLTRLLRESSSESRRRLFVEAGELYPWLDEVLDAAERARLREFVAEIDLTLPPVTRRSSWPLLRRPKSPRG